MHQPRWSLCSFTYTRPTESATQTQLQLRLQTHIGLIPSSIVFGARTYIYCHKLQQKDSSCSWEMKAGHRSAVFEKRTPANSQARTATTKWLSCISPLWRLNGSQRPLICRLQLTVNFYYTSPVSQLKVDAKCSSWTSHQHWHVHTHQSLISSISLKHSNPFIFFLKFIVFFQPSVMKFIIAA